jgi:hypothetical protein
VCVCVREVTCAGCRHHFISTTLTAVLALGGKLSRLLLQVRVKVKVT